jgi:4-aminobutyrate aminotransferase/diaminobutyrate-pyruvate transaminase/4-aminobutyrate aminotransferase/(S)-3-amino-2-methylpropionate transaminase
LLNSFQQTPQETARIETTYRRIATPLPTPAAADVLSRSERVFPRVNCYQPPVVWDRAEGFQVYDADGNCWIDFTSCAVLANSGHGHPAIRSALAEHAANGLLAQFSFASEVRVQLAERLLELAPRGVEKVYFWTTGSEAVESALRLAREWAMRRDFRKYHVFSFTGDYHGCTLGAHQLSGDSPAKPWLDRPDSAIHRLPFPRCPGETESGGRDWERELSAAIEAAGVLPYHIAAVVIETMQGWGALPLPKAFVQTLRRWADQHDVLLVFDEIQTGFARTGRWFGHQHYEVRPDLICIGKGVTSSLPLAAVLGPAEVLDVLPPGEVTTTHAGHPLSCVAALANLKVIEREGLLDRATAIGEVVRSELRAIQNRWPDRVACVSGWGLLNAIHFQDPTSGTLDPYLARDVTSEAVRRGVMLFQVNRPTVKICPPLIIPTDAAVEGVRALGEAVEYVVRNRR